MLTSIPREGAIERYWRSERSSSSGLFRIRMDSTTDATICRILGCTFVNVITESWKERPQRTPTPAQTLGITGRYRELFAPPIANLKRQPWPDTLRIQERVLAERPFILVLTLDVSLSSAGNVLTRMSPLHRRRRRRVHAHRQRFFEDDEFSSRCRELNSSPKADQNAYVRRTIPSNNGREYSTRAAPQQAFWFDIAARARACSSGHGGSRIKSALIR